MQYYKILEVENIISIVEKTKKYIFSHIDIEPGFIMLEWKKYVFFCPEILQLFKKYNLVPVSAALYITLKSDDSKIHIDYVSDKKHQCRINIPILNCEGSKTEFFKGGEYLNKTQNNGLTYLEIDDYDKFLIKVDEVEITKPTIIRVQHPHRVVMDINSTPRICMTLFMNRDPVILLK